MMTVIWKDNSEEKRSLYREIGKSSGFKGLDSFIKRIEEDMATNMISETDGLSLIVMTTFLINTLSMP
ncbi:MAG: hypothetical protein ABFD82_07515 [Syntrophaceae bacterium]